MSFSESLFMFEIRVEDLKSCNDTKRFRIRSQFGDVFTLHLKDPNDGVPDGPIRPGTWKRPSVTTGPVPTVQTVLVSANINSLELHMEKFPMYLCAWGKGNSYSLGSTHIPWSPRYIDYLESLRRFENPEPVLVKGKYSIFNEYNSKKMATIWLSVKLTRMAGQVQHKVDPLRPACMTPSFSVYNEDPETNVNIYGEKPKPENIGVIRTVYGGDNQLVKKKHSKKIKKLFVARSTTKEPQKLMSVESKQPIIETNPLSNENKKIIFNVHNKNKSVKSLLVRSNTEICMKSNTLIKSKSCSSIQSKRRLGIYDYIFSESNGPFGNKVYCVGYCTVDNDKSPKGSPPKQSSNSSSTTQEPKGLPITSKEGSEKDSLSNNKNAQKENSDKSSEDIEKYTFNICGDDCERKAEIKKCFDNVCPIDVSSKVGHLIRMTKCTERLKCKNKLNDLAPTQQDKQLLLNIENYKRPCCEVEEVAGEMKMEMKADDPCFCTCECKFGYRKTTYCNICGGYEIPGVSGVEHPDSFPCPIFHKIERKQKVVEKKKKRSKGSSLDSGERAGLNKTDDRFKFNYGYKGIPPQIGHSQCCMPCGGATGPVPNHMGWLWNAGNVPGLKFRPCWRPGAANKHVVRMLRHALHPDLATAKKFRKKQQHVKRPLKRPLLVVEKKDGEYTVTMETMKVVNKPRLPNIYPYEDKPAITFKVGRTDEENVIRARIKARAQKNLEREKRQFIQQTFQNLCKDICYKTYQQALGILPGDEDLPCPCLPALPDADRVDLDRACSCSDQSRSSDATATDDDEWIVEFTPPNALFDPASKNKMAKRGKQDRESQYTYLDYAVKLTDRYGSPVPRFFLGPDGKKQCSDLGGFWDANNNWMEINVDGYVALDGRWAPWSFLGPNGEQIDAEDGKFQNSKGDWLMVGIDGYVENGQWRKYSKPKPLPEKLKKLQKQQAKKATGDKKNTPGTINPKLKMAASETTWSCLGDADPKELGKMGIFGHGQDRKLLLSTLQQLVKQGESVIMPKIRNASPRKKSKKMPKEGEHIDDLYEYDSQKYFSERAQCHHRPPSDKGIQAVDELGRKTYFRLKSPKNTRPQERVHAMKEKGISLSSFHVPCLSSFIDGVVARKQKIEHILRHNANVRHTAN